MKTTYFLDMRSEAADGMGSVRLRIVHNRTSTTMRTGIRLLPSEWNGTKVIHRPDSDLINVRLQSFKAETDKAILLLELRDDFNSLTATDVKNLISKPQTQRENLSVSSVFMDYMDSKKMKDTTKSMYRITLDKILSFSGDINITDINLKWLFRFESHLAEKQRTNGRAIYLRCLRAVCNYAVNIGLVSDYPFANFQIKQEPTMKRSVEMERFRAFMSHEVTTTVARYRDYLLLMFYLIGINAVDLFLARPSQLKNGRLEYIRSKTGKLYSVKIEPEAQVLLDKYKGNKYLVEVMDHCKYYKSHLKLMNSALRSVGDVRLEMIPDADNLFAAPKLEKVVTPVIPEITTYYARHCWATFAHEIGIPIDVISQAMGHSMGNRTTLIYVKPDQTKVDEANRKVIDYFIQSGGL